MTSIESARILRNAPRPSSDDDTILVNDKVTGQLEEVEATRFTTIGLITTVGRPVWANTFEVDGVPHCQWHLHLGDNMDSVQVIMYSSEEKPCHFCTDALHWPRDEAGYWAHPNGVIIDGWTSVGLTTADEVPMLPVRLPSTLTDLHTVLLDFAERGLRWRWVAATDSLYPIDEAGRVAEGWDAEAWEPWLHEAFAICERHEIGLPQMILNAEAVARETRGN